MSQPYVNPHEPVTLSDLAREEAELERDKGRFAKPRGTEQVPTNPLNIPKQPPTSFSNQAAALPDEPPIDASDCGDTYGQDLTKVGG